MALEKVQPVPCVIGRVNKFGCQHFRLLAVKPDIDTT